MPPVKPKVRADLGVVEIDGEAIVYDEKGRTLHHLNPSATLVFGLCDGRSTIPELSSEIAEAVGLPSDQVERQVRGLLRQFRKQAFLDGRTTNGARPTNPPSREKSMSAKERTKR